MPSGAGAGPSPQPESLVRISTDRPEPFGRDPALHDRRVLAALDVDAVDHQRRPPVAVPAPSHDEHLPGKDPRV